MTVANIRITQIKLKRGNTTVSNTYTGPRSELTHDTGPAGTGPHTVRIHDGITPGGTILASQGWVDSALANVVMGNINVSSDGANVTISNTAPTVVQGNLWYNTDDGRAYLYAGGVWRDFSPQVIPANMVSYDAASGDLILNDGAEITYSNGVSILSGLGGGGGSDYGNANVAAYLPVYGGNVLASAIGNGFALTVSQIQLPDNTGPLNVINNAGAINIISNQDTPKVWQFGTDGSLNIPGNTVTSSLYTDNNGFRLNLEGNNSGVTTAKLVLDNDNGHIRLIIGNVSTPAIWAFRDNGNVTFPDATVQTTAWTGASGDNTQVQFNDSGTLAGHPNFTYDVNTDTLSVPGNLIVDNIFSVDSTVVHVHDDLETYGDFTAQGMYLKEGGSLVTLGNNVVDLNSLGNLNIQATAETWTFSNTGTLTFPDMTVQSTAYTGPGNIDSLTDVDTSTTPPSVGEVLKWDGTNWVPGTDNSSGGGSGIALTDLHAANISASGSGYLAYNEISGTFEYAPPDLSVYATNANLEATNANVAAANVIIGNLEYSQTLIFSNIEIINANLGSYQTWANANVSSLQDQIIGANTDIQITSANLGSYQTWANATFSTSTYSNTTANALLSITSIDALSDVDTTTAPPSVGNVLKWDGTNWIPGTDGGGGGGISLTDLHAANTSASGSGYLAYNSINGTFTYAPPDLSGYATTIDLQTLDANVGAYETWANANFATGSAYSNTNVAAYLASQNISSQIQVDWNQATVGNVAYIKNKPDLSVYATNTALDTLSANVGAYEIWANAQINTVNANLGAYQTYANANIGTLFLGNISTNANLGAYQLYVNANIGTDRVWLANLEANAGAQAVSITNLQNSINGTVLTANVAYYPNVTATTTNAIHYPGMYNAATGNLLTYTSANLQFNPGAGNLFLANAWLTTSATTATIFNGTPTTINLGGGATTINLGAANGNVNVAGNVVATANLWAQGGSLRTSAATAYLFNATPTTVYMAGGATIGTYIGHASGITQLYGNVQGSTNGFAIGYRDIPQVTFSGNATAAFSDAGKHYYSTSSSNLIFTVPTNANVAFATGAAINIINQGTGTITISPAGGVTMYLAGNSTAGSRTLSSYGMATVQKVATDTWFLVGVGLT